MLTNSKDQTIKLWDVRNFSEEKMAIDVQNSISDDPRRRDYRYENPIDLANKDYRRKIIRRNKSKLFFQVGNRVLAVISLFF